MRTESNQSQLPAWVTAAIAKGGMVAIDAANRIYVATAGGNGPRFARLFQDAWLRVPVPVRQSIIEHWQEHKPFIPIGDLSPQILLSEFDFRYDRCTEDWAGVRHEGHALFFRSSVMDMMPDTVVQAVTLKKIFTPRLCSVEPQ